MIVTDLSDFSFVLDKFIEKTKNFFYFNYEFRLCHEVFFYTDYPTTISLFFYDIVNNVCCLGSVSILYSSDNNLHDYKITFKDNSVPLDFLLLNKKAAGEFLPNYSYSSKKDVSEEQHIDSFIVNFFKWLGCSKSFKSFVKKELEESIDILLGEVVF